MWHWCHRTRLLLRFFWFFLLWLNWRTSRTDHLNRPSTGVVIAIRWHCRTSTDKCWYTTCLQSTKINCMLFSRLNCNRHQVSLKPAVLNTLTAARRVRALRASLPGVFVWSNLPCYDDIDEVGCCDGCFATRPKLLLDARLRGLRGLILDPGAFRVSGVGLTSGQSHCTIGWLHGSPFCFLLLVFWESGGSADRHIIFAFMFILLHLGYIYLCGRGCCIHQSSKSISCSTEARATLGRSSSCCWTGPERHNKKTKSRTMSAITSPDFDVS